VVIEHEPGDLTCTVGADVPLAELQPVLARGGQMLALDPPGAAGMTVGEAFAAAASGPRAHRYGLPRDLVLGVTVRLADGTVARGGGRVVKTVAGYDLPKLFTGAGGRLGEILELTLRLHPLPADTCTVVAEPGDPTVLEPLAPACVEYAWPPGRMFVRFESPVARALAEQALELVGGDLVASDEPLWAEHRERAVGLALTRCLPADVPATIDALRAAGATAIVGRYARGLLYADASLRSRAPDSRLEALERRVMEAYAG
jgi:glycolate dehydrogenase FAD-binding subunit